MVFHSAPLSCFPPAEPSRRAILLCPPGFSCRSMNKAMAHTSGARPRLIGRIMTCQVLPSEQSHPCLHRPLSAILQTQQGRPSLSTSKSLIRNQIPKSFPFTSKSPQTCFVLPITSPLTFPQSILLSSSSSTKPQTTTLSPRTKYKPCGCSVEGSSSPCSRMMRSIVSASTRLVTWSQETSVPVRVRPSTVMMRTFSVGRRWGLVGVLGREGGFEMGQTVYVLVERHCRGGGVLGCCWGV